MPEMNGPALAQRLIGLRPELRVLFISGYADMADRRSSADNPNIGFLSKPFQASVLTARVRRCWRGRAARAGVSAHDGAEAHTARSWRAELCENGDVSVHA